MRRDVSLDGASLMGYERAECASVGLAVGEGVLGQVVLSHEALAAHPAREVLGAVRGFVLAEGRALGEATPAEGARVGRLLGVGPVVGQQLGAIAEHARAQAAGASAQVTLPMAVGAITGTHVAPGSRRRRRSFSWLGLFLRTHLGQ